MVQYITDIHSNPLSWPAITIRVVSAIQRGAFDSQLVISHRIRGTKFRECQDVWLLGINETNDFTPFVNCRLAISVNNVQACQGICRYVFISIIQWFNATSNITLVADISVTSYQKLSVSSPVVSGALLSRGMGVHGCSDACRSAVFEARSGVSAAFGVSFCCTSSFLGSWEAAGSSVRRLDDSLSSDLLLGLFLESDVAVC